MQRSVLPLLLLATGLQAQGFVPPATLRAFQQHAALSTPAVPGASVEQIHMIALPGDPPGTYTCTLSVRTLPAANGGVGGGDILSGKYNALTDVFTPDLNAASLNATGEDFGFMTHSSGLVGVWDRLTTVEVATRPNVTSAWTRKGSVTGLPPGPGYFDPSVANVNGKLVLLFVTGTTASSIAYAPLDINTLAVGTPTIVVNGSRGGSFANSPTPIVTSSGELVALSHHDLLGSDNDHYMSMDLDPTTPSVLFVDDTAWKNNGGFAGGMFFEAHSPPTPIHVISTEAAWWTGGRAAIGTNMEITASVKPKASGVPSISFALLSRAFLTSPVPIAGVTGPLGVDPSFLILIGLGAHTLQTGQATINIGVPNDPSLRGVVIPGQSLTIDLTPPTLLILGNTAAFTILP